MFKRIHRLARQTEVRYTISRGRSFFSPYFTVKFLKKPEGNAVRFAVIVSTKVSKKATVRNRLKRIIREVLRNHVHGFTPGDYAVIARSSTAALTSKQVSEFLIKLLLQTRLLKL